MTYYSHMSPQLPETGHTVLYSNTKVAYNDYAPPSAPEYSRKQRIQPVLRSQPTESVRPTQPALQVEENSFTQPHVHTNGGEVSWVWSLERIKAHLYQLGTTGAKFRNAGLPHYALNGPYHPLLSECTAAVVDITVLRNLKITVEELLTFFPAHTSWRDFAHRLQRNGWTATPTTRMIYYTRSLTDSELLKRNTVYKQMEASDKALDGVVYNKKNPRPTNLPRINDYTCGGRGNNKRATTGGNKYLLNDWYLEDCAKGVTIEPAGLGRGLCTEALVHARENNNNPRLPRLNEVSQYVLGHGLKTDLSTGSGDPNPDVEALCRMEVVLPQYAKSIGLKK